MTLFYLLSVYVGMCVLYFAFLYVGLWLMGRTGILPRDWLGL